MENEMKDNKSRKKFTVGFIIFVIILGLLTAVAIYYTFRFIDNKNQEKYEQFIANQNEEDDDIEHQKKTAPDQKYALTSYSETYSNNPLKINYIEDEYKYYIQIEGLKNEKIQNQINERIKKIAYDLNCKNVYAYASANFSNILSVSISGTNEYGEELKEEAINIDLNTGKDIPFEDIFISSAPINLYLANALYESMAWNPEIIENPESYEYQYNMDYRDTSEYEDKFLMIINRYKENKNKIKYNISPQGVCIYGLTEGIIGNEDYVPPITIKFIDCIDQVAIYKKYLTNSNIYKDAETKPRKIIVLTDDKEYIEYLNYGLIEDGLFVEDGIYKRYEEDQNVNIIEKFINKISKEKINEIKSMKSNDKGIIYQAVYYINKNEETKQYELSISEAIVTSSRKYFEKNALRDYINVSNRSGGGDSISTFYEDDNTDELKVKNTEEIYYFSYDGKLLKSEKL